MLLGLKPKTRRHLVDLADRVWTLSAGVEVALVKSKAQWRRGHDCGARRSQKPSSGSQGEAVER